VARDGVLLVAVGCGCRQNEQQEAEALVDAIASAPSLIARCAGGVRAVVDGELGADVTGAGIRSGSRDETLASCPRRSPAAASCERRRGTSRDGW